MAIKKKKGKVRIKKSIKTSLKKIVVKEKTKVSLKESFEGTQKTKIRIIGIGGGGSNIVGEIAKTVGKADFVSVNTDLQAQRNLPKSIRGFLFGQDLTKGLGCGMDALLGETAAKAEKDRIKKLVEGQDVCILVATLGGGTGSGATPVIAEAAKEAKCLTLGIFTMPFAFEGERRKELADVALAKIIPLLNAYSIIPNENIFRVIDQKTPIRASFSAVNKRLAETLEGFIDTLALPGFINIDFADIKTLLDGRGKLAYINSVQMQGAPRAQLALKEVLNSPLYDYSIDGAERIVFNLTGDKTMKMQEAAEISKAISSFNIKARIIFGISFQPEYKDKLRISLFAVGCKEKNSKKEEKVLEKPKTRLDSPSSARREKKKSLKKTLNKINKTKEKVIPPKSGEGGKKTLLPAPKEEHKESGKVRRNALDLKKARDLELKDLEKQERQWDIPSFLRNTKREELA